MLYRRAHNALVSEISSVVPVDQVKSIDELSCALDDTQRSDPAGLAATIKRTIRYNIGATITCFIGFAANRHLAKIAGGTQKPDGQTIWHPALMPAPLERLAPGDKRDCFHVSFIVDIPMTCRTAYRSPNRGLS